MLETILTWMGAGDQALSVMGPVLTIALAWLFGGSLTQWLKFPLSRIVDGHWYDWTVRTLAISSTAAFAHFLSDALPWPVEIGVGVSQALAYKGAVALMRKYAPWLEVSKVIGSVVPPAAAVEAAAARAAYRESQP